MTSLSSRILRKVNQFFSESGPNENNNEEMNSEISNFEMFDSDVSTDIIEEDENDSLNNLSMKSKLMDLSKEAYLLRIGVKFFEQT